MIKLPKEIEKELNKMLEEIGTNIEEQYEEFEEYIKKRNNPISFKEGIKQSKKGLHKLADTDYECVMSIANTGRVIFGDNISIIALVSDLIYTLLDEAHLNETQLKTSVALGVNEYHKRKNKKETKKETKKESKKETKDLKEMIDEILENLGE